MSSIEHLESRIAPASLTGRVLSYTDIDGDKVTVAFTKGTLSEANFTFDNAFGSTGPQQLQRIDISGLADVEGSNLTVKVVRSATGNGVAHIGEIIAMGRDLGVVKTKGDVEKIVAGNDTAPAPAIKALTIGSYGMLDGTTQPAGSNQSTTITGDLPRVTIIGDVSGGAIGVTGAVTNFKIGGSVIGGEGGSEGRIILNKNVGVFTLGGSLIGGDDSQAGSLFFAANVGTIRVSGSIVGGSPDSDQVGPQVNVTGTVGKFIVGGDITGVTGTGKQKSIIVNGTIGSFTAGGNVTAPDGNLVGIYLADEVSVPGTAVGTILIKGTVKNAVIGAGADLNRPITVDRLTINGSFIKSRILVGTSVGADLMPGNGDDTINAASRLNSLVIKGTVFGTVGGTDIYLIEAGRIGSAKLGGRSIPVTPGGGLISVSFSGDVMLRDAA